MHDLLQQFLTWYMSALEEGGYGLIVLLMAMESSIIPLPSEVVIPPAAHLANTRGGMTLAGIVLAGTLGSWIGATVMYWGSRLIGRPLLIRYGRYLLVPPAKIAGAEAWANHYGTVGIFISRLLPVIRHLIGIPAGIVRMNFWYYSIATLAGSAIWCSVLVWLGVTAGQDQELLNGELHRVTVWVGGVLGVLGVIYYVFVHRHMRAQRR
ncbi:MAG: DedA family protein [Gammaproteobacteria bacterium]|nr:MAG: DedA family protein [Gammaproteobacteria bacterium]